VKWNPETGDAIRFKGKGHGTKVTNLATSTNVPLPTVASYRIFTVTSAVTGTPKLELC